MRVSWVCALLLLPQLVAAETTRDALIERIKAGDTPAVASALAEAVAADAAGAGEPLAQRKLFRVFELSDPAIASFAADWVKAEPDNALAMTAAGWNAYALAFDLRGSRLADYTTAEALRQFRSLQRRSIDLFRKAVAAEPDLLSASDGMLLSSHVLGRQNAIPGEIERVMALRPNRGSLQAAIWGPQWGGGMEIVDFLCERYARKITTVDGYDLDTCWIDAVYSADFPPGPDLDRARDALWQDDNPVLDYARTRDAIAGEGPAEARLTYLEDVMDGPDVEAGRQVRAEAAKAYDLAFMQAMGQSSSDLPEFRAALPASVAEAERNAELDPLNPEALFRLHELRRQDRDLNGATFDKAAFAQRLVTLLQGNPYSPDIWRLLGEIRLGKGSTAELVAAQPYFDNALYYARYQPEILKAVVDARIWLVFDQTSRVPLVDATGLPLAQQIEIDSQVYCPLLRDLLSAQMLCVQQGVTEPCLGGLPDDMQILGPLLKASERHQCEALAHGLDPSSLLIAAPVAVDLAQP